MADGSSLLFRLHLEGVDIGSRAEAQAKAWRKHSDDFVSLFFDGHHCFTSLLAGDRAANEKLLDNMREFIAGDRKGWNKEVTAKVGVPLVEGITAFADGDYDKSVDLLQPIMSDVLTMIQVKRSVGISLIKQR